MSLSPNGPPALAELYAPLIKAMVANDLDLAARIAQSVLEGVLMGDTARVDLDTDLAVAEPAAEALRLGKGSSAALTMAHAWREMVRKVELTDLGLGEEDRLRRTMSANAFTVDVALRCGEVHTAFRYAEAGIMVVRVEAGGDRALTQTAVCDPFGFIGGLYAEALECSLRAVRELPERVIRWQRIDRLIDDGVTIALQIDPDRPQEHCGRYGLVEELLVALDERGDPGDAALAAGLEETRKSLERHVG